MERKQYLFPLSVGLDVFVCALVLMLTYRVALGNYSGLLNIIPIVKADLV